MSQTQWILCPVCGNKTRTMIREDTEMKNFPLYCPKCKKETIINVKDMKITLVRTPKLQNEALDGALKLL